MTETAKKKKPGRPAAAKMTKPASKHAATPAKAKSIPTSKRGATSAKAKSKPASKRAATPAKAKSKPASKSGATSAKAKSKPASKRAATSAKAKSKSAKSVNKTKRPTAKSPSRGAKANPVAGEANRRHASRNRRASREDLFLEDAKPARARKASSGAGRGDPPKRGGTLFGVLNACLAVAIMALIALGIRQQSAYADFLKMRDVVDQQTFYDGTTVEGVDVSKMTLSNALDYWRERVEPRYANRTATLDNGMTVTARELGYTSDYEAVLSAAWSAGRSGSLEQRYRMAANRRQNPVAYSVTRMDYSDARVEEFAAAVAAEVDQPARDAAVADFNAETYEFEFTESQPGRELDREALKQSIKGAIAGGGGNVSLQIAELQPAITTQEVSENYGLIDYAVTNASSSSRARMNNIKLATSFINGIRVAAGETFSFNKAVGQRTAERGFRKATAYSGGEVTEQVGGGICQVSTTLFNAAVKADMEIVERHNHSLTVSYVDKGKDATVDWGHQDLRFKNNSSDDVFICCYVTDDKRVRFGIFGRLLPNGEKITLEGVTTEVVKYETDYQPSPLLAPGQTFVLQEGKNGYKAEAYKIRWDAQGNQLSKELLCKSLYKMKKEIVQYGE